METEVKLAFKSKEEMMSVIHADWFADYCLDACEKEPVKLNNNYYDTPDRTLLKNGTSIRVRLYESGTESHYEHTVKYGGSVVNGLHQRYEWNMESDSPEFDVAEFRRKACNGDDDPEEILDEALGGVKTEDLVCLCSTYCERTNYSFGYGDSLMEASFDTGTISAGDKSEEICELELELESGDVVDLKDMAQFIVDNTDSYLYDESKYMRAVRLLDSVNDK